MTRLLDDASRFALWRWQHIVTDDTPYVTKLYLVRTPWFQWCLHRIHRRDNDRAMHDHPRDFVSIVLRGGYLEERPTRANDWTTIDSSITPTPATFLTYRPAGSIARRRAEDLHRIIRVDPGTLTLVLWGRQRRAWGFRTEFGWVHWRRYLGLEPVGSELRPSLLDRLKARLSRLDQHQKERGT